MTRYPRLYCSKYNKNHSSLPGSEEETNRSYLGIMCAVASS